MGTLINLVGQKFNRLNVIKRADKDKWGNATWLCKCECGTEKVIAGNDLINGNTKSCGCLRNERVRDAIGLKPGLANMRALISSYKKEARRRGLEYKLTEEQFSELTQMDCHYCGAKPNGIFNDKGCNGKYIYNGIDRIDNNRGYTIDNINSCCKWCNQAKSNRTLQEYKDWIKRSYNKRFGDNII
jgi:hypothetical protein